jgi:predicted nucleotidyltransferase
MAFGSFARGTAGIDSDVDVLAIRPRGTEQLEDHWVESLGRWTDEVTRIVENPVRLVLANEAEVPGLLRRRQSVWAEALEEGIILSDARLENIGSVA